MKPTWGKDQPNNYNGEQNCAVLDGARSWLWNDVGCNLDYLHFVCQHPPLSCGSPDILHNTTIVGRNFSIGATIEYKCPKEHSLVGNASRECQPNGVWGNTAPTCKCKFNVKPLRKVINLSLYRYRLRSASAAWTWGNYYVWRPN